MTVTGEPIPFAAPPGAWEMYRALVGVGLLCGALIATVFQLTRPSIERNKAEFLERAIYQVLPGASSSRAFGLDDTQRFVALAGGAQGGPRVYAGYDGDDRLVGVAAEAEGMGYQDVIRLLYGYSLADEAIIGIRVLDSKETPGLGDRIEHDPAFLENFRKLDVALAPDDAAILHPIVAVKHGKKKQPWEIDAITGATISSNAIARILGESTAYWIPRIRRRAEDFRSAEKR